MATKILKARSKRNHTGLIVAALAAASALGIFHSKSRWKPGLLARFVDGAAMAVAAREVLVPAVARSRARVAGWMPR